MQGPYYADFKVEQLSVAVGTSTAIIEPQVSSDTLLTSEMILKKVQDAILVVLGTAIGAEEPLANAGLDSLGEPFN